MQTIEQRLQAAEATLEIMRLKSLYASYADGKYTDDHQKKPVEERDGIARRQAECFTEDGEFDAGNRASGWNAWLTFAISEAAPPTVTPTKHQITK